MLNERGENWILDPVSLFVTMRAFALVSWLKFCWRSFSVYLIAGGIFWLGSRLCPYLLCSVATNCPTGGYIPVVGEMKKLQRASIISVCWGSLAERHYRMSNVFMGF